MAELKACQSASQSAWVCVCVSVCEYAYACVWLRASRLTLTTLPHWLRSNSNKRFIIHFQTHLPHCAIQLNVPPPCPTPLPHFKLMSKCYRGQKSWFQLAQKLQKFHCNCSCCCCCYCFAAPCGAFRGCRFPLDSNMTSTNNTDSPPASCLLLPASCCISVAP